MTDFTPKHDWASLDETVRLARLADPPESWDDLSTRLGIPKHSLYSHYGPKTGAARRLWPKPETVAPEAAQDAKQASFQTPTATADGLTQQGEGASPTALESARTNARKLLSDAVSGLADPSAQQIAAARLLLKDELEPADAAGSPFAGIPTDELALRALTLAVSTLGLVRVAALLREEAKRGTLDLGLDWTPDGLTASGQDAEQAEAKPAEQTGDSGTGDAGPTPQG